MTADNQIHGDMEVQGKNTVLEQQTENSVSMLVLDSGETDIPHDEEVSVDFDTTLHGEMDQLDGFDGGPEFILPSDGTYGISGGITFTDELEEYRIGPGINGTRRADIDWRDGLEGAVNTVTFPEIPFKRNEGDEITFKVRVRTENEGSVEIDSSSSRPVTWLKVRRY